MLTKITATVLLFAISGIVLTSDAIDGANVSAGIVSPGQALSHANSNIGPKAMNESSYKSFLNMVQTMYREDFNYSGGILENYVNKSITNRDAMVATSSIFIMTSHSIALLETNKPPEMYEDAYNNTRLGMIYLRAFLWNMSKFYETSKNTYLVQARANLNNSVSYYKIGQENLTSPKP